MILTTGVDLIELDRIRRLVDRYGSRALGRVYTPRELAHCGGRVPELAARFAAKEAVSKALGVGLRIWFVMVSIGTTSRRCLIPRASPSFTFMAAPLLALQS